MTDIINITQNIPPMLTGEKLLSEMSVFPEYNENIINKTIAERLMALSDIYKIYIPTRMSQEIYSKLYLALIRSLQKKCSGIIIKQQLENFKMMQHKNYSGGIIGGSDSFSIIGNSGIGKSASIFRALDLIGNGVIEVENPYAKIIPCLVVQTPFDSSTKGLMLEILRKVDETLGSKYYETALKKKSTTDTLIGCVSQIALNNIGMIIIDEIQNVCNSKNGNNLVGSITQLVNNSGISICFVGTPECKNFFTKAMHLARRTVGLQYKSLEYDSEFIAFCKAVFQYQYMNKRIEITDKIIEWLYIHSGGNLSIVISILHDAQEIGILSNKNELNIQLMEQAYKNRIELLHSYIEIPTVKLQKRSAKKENQQDVQVVQNRLISSLVAESKQSNIDIVDLLKKHISVVEVAI